MPKPKFVCRRCGKCCKENWEVIVDFQKDILRWIQEKRFDILKHVVLNPKFILNPEYYHNKPQWIIDSGHLLFGDVSHRCPFLEEGIGELSARCRIHETRPRVCRRFPYDGRSGVRADILDVCMGSIFYHSKVAEREGLSFVEYMEKLDLERRKGPPLGPKKDELMEIAQYFRDKDLKVQFTSDLGLNMAEELLAIKTEILRKIQH